MAAAADANLGGNAAGACSARSTPAAWPAVQNNMDSRMVDTAGTERSWSTCDALSEGWDSGKGYK